MNAMQFQAARAREGRGRGRGDAEAAWFRLVERAARLDPMTGDRGRWRRKATGEAYRVAGCCLRDGDLAPCLLCVRVGDRASVKFSKPLADFLEEFEEAA